MWKFMLMINILQFLMKYLIIIVLINTRIVIEIKTEEAIWIIIEKKMNQKNI